jgi:hypothetical protein
MPIGGLMPAPSSSRVRLLSCACHFSIPPLLSLTAAHENHIVGAPSEAYVKTIISGLEETYPCMRKSKILAYLRGAEGIREAIPGDTLNRWVLDC